MIFPDSTILQMNSTIYSKRHNFQLLLCVLVANVFNLRRHFHDIIIHLFQEVFMSTCFPWGKSHSLLGYLSTLSLCCVSVSVSVSASVYVKSLGLINVYELEMGMFPHWILSGSCILQSRRMLNFVSPLFQRKLYNHSLILWSNAVLTKSNTNHFHWTGIVKFKQNSEKKLVSGGWGTS